MMTSKLLIIRYFFRIVELTGDDIRNDSMNDYLSNLVQKVLGELETSALR